MEKPTKDRIIEESLELFSRKGYAGTSTKNIADAVGIKDSSLYKHFSGKKEIFDTIVTMAEDRMGQLAGKLELPDVEEAAATAARYSDLSGEDFVELCDKVFAFYLEDEMISRFWRVMLIEQYRSREVAGVLHELFMENSIAYQTKVFSCLTESGTLSGAEPETMAVEFYSTVFFLLCKYNGQPERRDEAFAVLDRQMLSFYMKYNSGVLSKGGRK